MKTDIRHIAALVATSIWADGEYDAAEKIVVAEIADAVTPVPGGVGSVTTTVLLKHTVMSAEKTLYA